MSKKEFCHLHFHTSYSLLDGAVKIKEAMEPAKYAFWYEGQPWVGAPERGINEGDLRDGGSLEERSRNVAYWHQWPDEYDHLIMRWDEFLNA